MCLGGRRVEDAANVARGTGWGPAAFHAGMAEDEVLHKKLDRCGLGGEPTFAPRAVVRALKFTPVVEPAFPVVPELDGVGREHKPTPVRWARDRSVGEPRLELPNPRFKLFAVSDRLTLRARPGADLRTPVTAREVGIGRLGGRLFYRAASPDLNSRGVPVKRQCRHRRTLELVGLSALVVREEHEAFGTHLANKNEPHVGPSGRIHRREGGSRRVEGLAGFGSG